MSNKVCRCEEAGYYHCSELRNKIEKLRESLQLIVDNKKIKDLFPDVYNNAMISLNYDPSNAGENE